MVASGGTDGIYGGRRREAEEEQLDEVVNQNRRHGGRWLGFVRSWHTSERNWWASQVE
jgi:hypothetical protein